MPPERERRTIVIAGAHSSLVEPLVGLWRWLPVMS
jgi:hypothetical protein